MSYDITILYYNMWCIIATKFSNLAKRIHEILNGYDDESCVARPAGMGCYKIINNIFMGLKCIFRVHPTANAVTVVCGKV